MTAQVTPFAPSSSANFQFTATLDGNPYTVICTFNTYGQRYYINIFDSSQARVLTRPVVGSPDDYDISLTLGFFTTKIVFRESTQSFEVGG